ncbi:MAG: ergothioneine biosynthesis protein EgtB [Phycisphaerales bacterium]
MSRLDSEQHGPAGSTAPGFSTDAANLLAQFRRTRRETVALIEPLTEEDCCVQSQPCCSPVKWHLGHTTWFFERFIVVDGLGGSFYDDRFEYLFNSYYNALGERQPRAKRGLLTRPGLGEVLAFRSVVDEAIERALERGSFPEHLVMPLTLGLNHEQQHQELLLMDVKHLLSCSPLGIAYCEAPLERATGSAQDWIEFGEGMRTIGTVFGRDHRVYDNECPRHRVYLEPFALADRLVTNGEFAAFIGDGGYRRADLWLDMGWSFVRDHGWQRPAYWFERHGEPMEFTLHGVQPLDPHAPVVHVSYFEADAFARWAGHRLPTEFELEAAAQDSPGNEGSGRMLGEGRFHPAGAAAPSGRPRQLVGDCWEWTSSSYGPYPGFRAPPGAIGEYNGKFMCNQYVLRGGCVGTPRGHLRPTYRNFFEPEARWQFGGIRLARSQAQ